MRLENGFPQRHPRAGFAFYLSMILIISGCLTGLCYFTLLKDWYGEVVPSGSASAVPAAWANGLHVLLVDSRCPPQGSPPELEAWKQLLSRARVSFETVFEVPSNPVTAVGVLALPSAECLGESQRQAIRRWLERGGGVVITGALGVRDEASHRHSGDFLLEIAGVEVGARSGSDSPAYVTLATQLPLGLGLAPGERWRIQPGAWPVAVSTAGDGYWSDARLEPLPGQPIEQSVAIAHRVTSQGRVVWIGPGLDAVNPDQRNRSSWERFFLNCVYWVGRRPLAAVSNWPAGQPVAVVIAPEVRETAELPDALTMGQELRRRHVPVTFFLRLPPGEFPPGVNDLAQLGEIAVLENPVGSGPRFDQAKMMQQKERLQQVAQRPIRGVRVPDDPVDEATLKTLWGMGYRYFFSGASLLSAAPAVVHFSESFLFPLDARILVGLPCLGQDDFAVLSEYLGPAYSEQGIAEQLWQNVHKARRVGGLYVLNFRMDLLGSPSARSGVLRVADQLRDERAWLASASEVARWWARREQIGVAVAKLGQRRMRIAVANQGAEGLEEVLVLISLPYIPARFTVTPTVFSGQSVAPRILKEPEILQLRIRYIKAQTTLTWVIDLQ